MFCSDVLFVGSGSGCCFVWTAEQVRFILSFIRSFILSFIRSPALEDSADIQAVLRGWLEYLTNSKTSGKFGYLFRKCHAGVLDMFKIQESRWRAGRLSLACVYAYFVVPELSVHECVVFVCILAVVCGYDYVPVVLCLCLWPW